MKEGSSLGLDNVKEEERRRREARTGKTILRKAIVGVDIYTQSAVDQPRPMHRPAKDCFLTYE